MDNNINLNEDTIKNIQNMMKNGDMQSIVSQIPPDVMQNFQNMFSNSSANNGNLNHSHSNMSNNKNSASNVANNSNSTSYMENDNNKDSSFNAQNNSQASNLNNIDMNTIMKMSSIISKMNNSNDPRSNLLYSLKPYLREERKAKVDQYANLLNVAKIAELFNNTNNNSSQNMNNNNNNREGNPK